MDKSGKIFTIPSGINFVQAIAERLLEETKSDPLELTHYTILLPTKRSCLLLQEAFIHTDKVDALFLPKIKPLGDLSENDFSLIPDHQINGLSILPGIDPTKRILLLAKLIVEKTEINFNKALFLAKDLFKFLDEIQKERINFYEFNEIISANYALHWQQIFNFLKILFHEWPKILKEEKCLDVVERQNILLEQQAKIWKENPPKFPVWVAGSTGSVPATAELMKVVSHLPLGYIILPGLNLNLDDNLQKEIREDPCHPYYGMLNLLSNLNYKLSDVRPWPLEDANIPLKRNALLNQVFYPASVVTKWDQLKRKWTDIDKAVENLKLVLCANSKEEAEIIAIILREALEKSNQKVALVTADRKLARRVTAELRRWSITVESGVGLSLDKTKTGEFLKLLTSLVLHQTYTTWLSIFKHPLTSMGFSKEYFLEAVKEIELKLLRGSFITEDLETLIKKAYDLNLDKASNILEKTKIIFHDFFGLLKDNHVNLEKLIQTHIILAESLVTTDKVPGYEILWSDHDGNSVLNFLINMISTNSNISLSTGKDYFDFFNYFLAEHIIYKDYNVNSRLSILSPFEARLYQADLMILGGLNEGVWPSEPEFDPWLNRNMRTILGLPLPERYIGLSAHDFFQLACAPSVVMTRSLKKDAVVTTPSRWVKRLQIFLKSLGKEILVPNNWIEWRKMSNHIESISNFSPPYPKPPVHLRPRKLSVTQLQKLLHNPYIIYVETILKLSPLEPLEPIPNASIRGTLIHTILEKFLYDYERNHIPDPYNYLIALGKKIFSSLLFYPTVWGFWWPRYERVAQWFIKSLEFYKDKKLRTFLEISGQYTLTLSLGDYVLTAKADRIDLMKDGGLTIIDYKTGSIPSMRKVNQGFYPQLILEAIIAKAKGFSLIKESNKIQKLEFWKITGRNPAVEVINLPFDIDNLIEEHHEGIKKFLESFDDVNTAYPISVDYQTNDYIKSYQHLARMKEWIGQNI
ncbi:MAG: double-strand break repair protein AddB [Alphaproteobacteria bacterium]|nr:double-strand break repair protein AddB [Alphaproteobacteria bacterium]